MQQAGTRKKRRRVPQLRREELLDAAFRALKRLGPDKCRVTDVTKEAGAAKGTFYLYFSGWQDMLAALRHRVILRYGTDFQSRLAKDGPLDWSGFETEAVRFVRFLAFLGPMQRALFHETDDTGATHPGADTQSLLASFLERAMAAGAIRRIDPQSAAPLLFSVMHMCADRIGGHERDATALASLRDLLRHWLARSETVQAG